MKDFSVLYLFILMACVACSNPPLPTLQEDAVVAAHFSPQEIEEMSALLTSFDSLMVGTASLNDERLAVYKEKVAQILEDAKGVGRWGENHVSAEAVKGVLDRLSDETYAKLYTVSKVPTREGEKRRISPTTVKKGSAIRQMAEGIDQEAVRGYLNTISQTGDISPTITHRFYGDFDLQDPKQRLLLALDFMAYTISD